jgi:hypothetical protein
MSLLERFQAGSELDSHGEFSMDESKARQKMARFQLVNTEEFLMLVTQAAVAAGCSALDLTLGPAEVTVVAQGALLDHESLRSLDLFLFDSQPENVAYHLLAVAANAVEPSCVEPPVVAMTEDALRFTARLHHPLPHLESLLRDRLFHLPCPLSVNGETLVTDPLQGVARVTLLEQGPSIITLVRYGVVVSRKSRNCPIEHSAVAVADHLALDASFSHVVENDQFDRLMETVATMANQQLADRALAFEPEGPDREFLLAHFRADHPDPAGAALGECKFFPFADRSGHASYADICRQLKKAGKVLTATRRYNLQLRVPVLKIDDPHLDEALRFRMPVGAMQSAESEFALELTATRNKQAWESSHRPTELPPGQYLVQAMVSGTGWKAAIGFVSGPAGRSHVEVLYLDRLLASELLSDVPPGAAAVLNVQDSSLVSVDRSWTRLEGRGYRAIQKELAEHLRKLFRKLELDSTQLTPELVDYLLIALSEKNPPPVARTAPLFPTLDGGEPLSLQDVMKLKTPAMGLPYSYSANIPVDQVLPAPILEFAPDRHRALVAQLPSVTDVRSLQARLAILDAQMAKPRPAVLSTHDKWLVRRPFVHGTCLGEVGLTHGVGTTVWAEISWRGAVLEQESYPGGKVLAAKAVIEAPDLQPDAKLEGFVTDRSYKELCRALRATVMEMEKELLARPQPDLTAEILIKLVKAYPQAREHYWALPMFPTTTYGRLPASLQQLQEDLASHGHLLRGEQGLAVPGRIALVSPSRAVSAFLTEQLGVFTWQDAALVLRRYQAAAEFEKRSVLERIVLAGSYHIRVDLSQGRGQVAIETSSPERAGEVLCYVRGRFVCRKRGVIPPPFVAAVESEAFVLDESFQDVTVPAQVQVMLQERCTECMLLAAENKSAELVRIAWEYFSHRDRSADERSRFTQVVTLTRFDGEEVRLDAIVSEKIQGYVGTRFQTTVTPQGLVLRLEPEQHGLLRAFLRRGLQNLESILQKEEAYQTALAALPTKLHESLYTRSFTGDGILATIGVTQRRMTIGLDSEGRPAGRLRELEMPVAVIVSGASPDLKSRPNALARLSSKNFSALDRWSEQVCLDWVKERADDHDLMLHLLRLTLREIGSRSTRPAAQMANLLWDLPLFARVDKTRVSGSALAATLSETGPILVSAETFRVPGSAVYLPEGSEEASILRAVLGKDSLARYETPPLIKTDELASAVRRLVSWGFTPVSRTVSAINRWKEKDAEAAREKLIKKASKPDPRLELIAALKEDVCNLLGREHFRKSDNLFQALDYGSWPLGPPIYRPRGKSHFRLNAMHPGIRWLLAEAGDERHKRAARMMLLVHWVGMVNVASEELADVHEDRFLERLAEQMTRTFA